MLDTPGVLISVRPKFAKEIAVGRKTVELRRRFPQLEPGSWLVIYVTKPVGAVIGMVKVTSVLRAPVEQLWHEVKDYASVSRETYVDYFAGCSEGCGVFLGARRALGPLLPSEVDEIIPGFRPPQSFRYIAHPGLLAFERSDAGELNRAFWSQQIGGGKMGG